MNGFISSQIKSADSINESTGEAVLGVATWSDDVECKYKANTLNNKGTYVGGKFTQSEYEITTDIISFRANIIRLKNSAGDVVCIKEVQSLEVLESIQRVRIMI